MHRFFVDAVEDGYAKLSADDAAHALRVLRLRAGDAVTLCDGRGTDYDATLETAGGANVVCRVRGCIPARTEPRCRVTLFQCLPKTGKMEIVIQKCTELGVSAVVPVQSRYCVPEPKEFDKKLVRWQRVALEAAKQSRRGRVPEIGTPISIGQADPRAFGLFLTAYENEVDRTLKSVLRGVEPPASIGILIGPEGGLSEDEADALNQRGAISVSLGPRILRTETAGAAMLAQILYEVEP